jgi:hypothetical protein
VQNADSKSRFDDLDAALQSGSSENRVAVLRQVTDPLLSRADHLNQAQMGVFDGVLVELIERIEATTLLEVSPRVAPVAKALIDLAPNRARYSGAGFPEHSLTALVRGREASAGSA